MLLTNTTQELRHCWHVVATTDELGDEPLGVLLLGEPWVVVRLDGIVRAFVDRCPHRLAPMSAGAVVPGEHGAELQCGYHGWRFDGDARCTAIPALSADDHIPGRARLVPAFGVAERYGLIWIAPEEPLADLPTVPNEVALGLVWIRGDHGADGFDPIDVAEWGAVGIDAAWMSDVVVGCSAGQFIDNFLDIAHFPVVHAGTFGADEATEVGDLAVESEPDDLGPGTLRLRHAHEIVNREDPLVDTGEHPLVQPRVMEYTVKVPFSARLRIELPLTGVENTIVVVASPTGRERTTLFTVLLRNDLRGDAEAARHAVDYEMAVLAEVAER